MKLFRGASVRVLAVFAVLLIGTGAFAGVLPGEVDDFEDGSTEGWAEGGLSPNPPVNVGTGGPAGSGDNFLQNDAAGTSGAGSKLVMFNLAQWTGDFVAAGIVSITMDMANFGASPLQMRLAFQGVDGTELGSANAETLAADGQWHSLTFDIDQASLSTINGTDNWNTVMSSVSEMRILDAAAGPAWVGDAGDASLGVDNITATIVPVEMQRFSIE